MRKFSLVSHLVLIVLVAINLQSCGSIQQMIYGTPTPTFTNTPTFTATSTVTPSPTFTPTHTLTPTATPDFVATQKAAEFSELVTELTQKFSETAFLKTVDGEYHPLKDSTLAFAKKGYYRWETYPIHVKNFVLRTHLRMETANKSSPLTGCGIVFRTVGDFNESIFVKQEGIIEYFAGNQSVNSILFKYLKNPVDLDLLLILNERSYQVFFNGKRYFAGESVLDPDAGDLGYAVASGSNDDFGSKCTFTDTDLWEIKAR